MENFIFFAVFHANATLILLLSIELRKAEVF